jgi:glycosyltransferase involved in cell wall biosynthesis
MVNLKNNTILFYGPLGGKHKLILGGGETGNQKTIKVLKDNLFQIVFIPKPYPLFKTRIGGIIYFFQLFLCYLSFLYKSFSVRGSKSLHITAFYYHLIYFEYLLLLTSRLLKINTVYEIRAGGFVRSFQERTFIYRYFTKKSLKSAHVILVQGKEDIPFIKSLTNRPVYNYPNYVKETYILPNITKDRMQSSTINLIYFGRLVPSKNIDFIIEICNNLKNSGSNFHLSLIGTIDKNYEEYIKKMISSYGLDLNISLIDPKPEDELFHILRKMHFFIFPTVEKREGQSNSLTEAMSCGVVPIASNYGFNRSVIDDDYLIIDDFSTDLYTRKILEIWDQGLWSGYADKVHENVKKHYTESIVGKVVVEAHLSYVKRVNILITSPSLDETKNVSGISSVAKSIIEKGTNNYFHFITGRTDTQKSNLSWFLDQLILLVKFPVYIIKQSIMIVHLNTALNPPSIIRDSILVIISKILWTKVLVHIHGGKYLFQESKNPFLNLILKLLICLPDTVIVLSESEKKNIVARFNKNNININVLSNTINISSIPTFSIENNKTNTRIIFLGRIHESNGILDIIQAVRKLNEVDNKFIFEMCGKGPLEIHAKQELNKILGERFVFRGVVFGDEKWKYLFNSDIFLLPSKYGEGLPIALLEAMALGCVAVVTDDGSMSNVVIDKFNGYHVKRNDPVDIFEKLLILIRNQELRHYISNNAKTTIREKYNDNNYIKNLENIYQKVLNM